ncbi:endonuclease/exonuclease/phosphatase family protein [Microbacterium sp. JZ31]|uniref:endonuclease/exonuclease/phosphatase family protein n=1 Tax=Microbacterium sp. JZ31 TaxID=1906274 RepID=UPI001EE4B5FB|nr:endonuclease/exonuclease/phosphatase family protein [Microbacterium sp. JZ31]
MTSDASGPAPAPGDAALVGGVEPPELSVMTFNVLRARAASASWRRRGERIRTLLRRERPTLLGAQEALPHQAGLLRAALGDDYRSLGHGRDADGAGEGCPLLYDAARLELVEWEQRALSRRPDAPGSRSWGSLYPRIVVRAVFHDRATGGRFAAFNTHLDVLSPLARRRAAESIVTAAGDGAVIVTGDFNAGPATPARRTLVRGGLEDSWTVARTRLTLEWSTYVPRGRPRPGGPRIDAIHVRGFEVASVGIDARRVQGGSPSDHLPVQAVVRQRAAAA